MPSFDFISKVVSGKEKATRFSFIFLSIHQYILSKLSIIRGEYRLFFRLVTAFEHTKIGAQILIDQLKINIDAV